MLRPFSTYLLFVVTCSFFLMGMNGLHLNNSVNSKEIRTIQASVHTYNTHSHIDTKNNTSLPIDKNPLIENFDFEHEVEIELDILPSIEIISHNFNFKNSSAGFFDVHSTYAFTIIKIEFLDIFSPPPNC